jgi:hypothetical protein
MGAPPRNEGLREVVVNADEGLLSIRAAETLHRTFMMRARVWFIRRWIASYGSQIDVAIRR